MIVGYLTSLVVILTSQSWLLKLRLEEEEHSYDWHIYLFFLHTFCAFIESALVSKTSWSYHRWNLSHYKSLRRNRTWDLVRTWRGWAEVAAITASIVNLWNILTIQTVVRLFSLDLRWRIIFKLRYLDRQIKYMFRTNLFWVNQDGSWVYAGEVWQKLHEAYSKVLVIAGLGFTI